MATGRLLGTDNDTWTGGDGGQAAAIVQKWTAPATGKVTEIRVKISTAGTVKVALYADSLGEPGALLSAVNTAQSVSAGWNTITLSTPADVTNGTAYWLGFYGSVAAGMFYFKQYVSGMAIRYKIDTYSTWAWPATISGWTTQNDVEYSDRGWGVLVLSPSSISQPVSYGSPKLNLTLKPSSILQALAYGTPTVLTSAFIIYPSSIVQVVAVGVPSLRYHQILLPSSIVQPVVVGTPWIGIFGFIRPQSIVQQISIGSPTLLKYVWHVILDGQYNIESPEVNRAYVIGQDAYGNPVYGTAVDATEGALVGERLDFQQELAIPSDSQAASMASAILAKMRLSGKRGVILIPPNCGQELFDVVQVTDIGANQSAVKFRVVGLRFEYNPRQARYHHKLIVGAP